MILEQNPETGYWDRNLRTHVPEECADHPCAIHNHPSNHPLKDAPLNWRTDRKLLERICEHGIGHPDADAIDYLSTVIGFKAAQLEGIHGCCGCCA